MDLLLTLAFLVPFALICVYLSGWFASSETALTNLGAARIALLREERARNVDYVIRLRKQMDRALTAILIGNNIVNILLSSVAALVANARFSAAGVSVALGTVTFLLIVFGDIIPKSKAITDSQRVSLRNARSLYVMMRLLSPLTRLLLVVSRRLITLTGGRTDQPNMLVSDESIKGLATLGAQEGIIKTVEKDIIHKVFAFGDKRIQDIMLPIAGVFQIDENLDLADAAAAVAQRGFTRVPVKDPKGRITGILYSKDLLKRSKGRVRDLMRPPYFVSADADVTDVFEQMKGNRDHLAIVADKDKKALGIVTLEDILELLLGEIRDEYSEIKRKKKEASAVPPHTH